jgi:hypothetical protein
MVCLHFNFDSVPSERPSLIQRQPVNISHHSLMALLYEGCVAGIRLLLRVHLTPGGEMSSVSIQNRNVTRLGSRAPNSLYS